MTRDTWEPGNVLICAVTTTVAAFFFHPPAVPIFALLAILALLVELFKILE